jgi:hypothetical protein
MYDSGIAQLMWLNCTFYRTVNIKLKCTVWMILSFETKILFKEEKAGHTIPQLVSRSFSPQRLRLNPRPVHVAFVVDRVALGEVLSTSVFPCQYYFTKTMAIHSYQVSVCWSFYSTVFSMCVWRPMLTNGNVLCYHFFHVPFQNYWLLIYVFLCCFATRNQKSLFSYTLSVFCNTCLNH